jgi:hypothetical protein
MSRTERKTAPWCERLYFRVLVWVFVSAVFTMLVVKYSMSHGKLLCPPFYDDVAYFEDALHRLAVLERGGPVALIPDYLHFSPHSPFSSTMALAAFRVLGVHQWAPYVANGVIILALLLLVDHLAGHAPFYKKFAIILLVLSVPVSTEAVYEFRPDFAAALACAAGVALVLWRPFTEVKARDRFAAGACIGLALLFKPPTSPLTFAVMVVAIVVSVVLERSFSGAKWKTLGKSHAQFLVPAILIPLPHYLLTWEENYHYVYDPVFGNTRSVWESHFTRLGHLLYYLRGEGGQVMLGAELYPLLAIIGVGTVVLMRRKQWNALSRLSALAIATAIAYAIPTYVRMKQPFLGNCFDWLLILMAVYVLVQFANGSQGAWILFLVMAALCCVHRMVFIDRTDNAASELVLAQNRVNKGLYQALRIAMPDRYSRIYMTTTGGVSPAALDYYFRRDTRQPLNIGDNPFTDHLEVHRREITVAEFVIASEPGNGLAFGDFVKSESVQAQTLDMVRLSHEFQQIAAFPALNGKSYFLFRRTRPFFGCASSQGLIESSTGAQGVAPFTRLTIAPEGRAELRLIARAISQTAELQVQIVVDGQSIHMWTPPQDHFEDFNLPFVIHGGGPHEIELRYTSPHMIGPRPILFTRLEVIPDCLQ